MKMTSVTSVVLGILVLTFLSDCHLIDNINNVIVSTFEASYNVEGKNTGGREQINKFIDDVTSPDDDIDKRDNVQIFLDACSTEVNSSVCAETLKENCPDVKGLVNAVESLGSEALGVSDVFPLVIYRLYAPACTARNQPKHGGGLHKPSSAQAWGYGIGFVTLVCVISNIGGFMTPLMSLAYFQRILLFCVALAVGTLGSTGMLVLIPESMHLTGEDSPIPDYHLKMATVLGGVYFFYLSEKLLKLWIKRKKKNPLDADVVVSPSDSKEDAELMDKNNGHSHFLEYETKRKESDKLQEESNTPPSPKSRKDISTVAWMVLMGDALHNFVDGMSIGAGFTQNTYLGISVSIAVLCEELPHELGDIAILLNSGLSMKRALLYNFLAAVICYAGLVLGILLGENTDANTWIFALAGGMFVYISLVDMIPEMNEQERTVVGTGVETMAMTMFIQNLGLLIGFAIIFMIAMYGGNIQV